MLPPEGSDEGKDKIVEDFHEAAPFDHAATIPLLHDVDSIVIADMVTGIIDDMVSGLNRLRHVTIDDASIVLFHRVVVALISRRQQRCS